MDRREFVDDQRWLASNDHAIKLREEEDDDEALSLSDLPLFHQWRKENSNDGDNDHNENTSLVGEGDDFDFCSFSKESEMCAADELFFKGRILPLRHSISSEKPLLLQHYDAGGGSFHRSFSRSDSMDHYYSSRSSSMSSSHHSSTTTTSRSSSAAAVKHKPKLPPRVHFHSHPSPSPRLHFPSSRRGAETTSATANYKKSSIWNVLRNGLVAAPPEIKFHDLKARSSSRNSNSSTSSSTATAVAAKKKKMRGRILSGGCRCAADAVTPRVVIIKRSASECDDVVALHDRRISGGEKPQKKAAASAKKKQISHHRTFEWLKQLPVEGAVHQT